MSDKEPHYDCLQTVSILLNRAQDIEDVLRDCEKSISSGTPVTPDVLVARIREINNKSLEVAAHFLPCEW